MASVSAGPSLVLSAGSPALMEPPRGPVFKGISLDKKDGRYRVRITCGGKRFFLGKWADPVEAARVYDRAAVLLHGHNAATNFGTAAALADVNCPLKQELVDSMRAQAALDRQQGPQDRKPFKRQTHSTMPGLASPAGRPPTCLGLHSAASSPGPWTTTGAAGPPGMPCGQLRSELSFAPADVAGLQQGWQANTSAFAAAAASAPMRAYAVASAPTSPQRTWTAMPASVTSAAGAWQPPPAATAAPSGFFFQPTGQPASAPTSPARWGPAPLAVGATSDAAAFHQELMSQLAAQETVLTMQASLHHSSSNPPSPKPWPAGAGQDAATHSLAHMQNQLAQAAAAAGAWPPPNALHAALSGGAPLSVSSAPTSPPHAVLGAPPLQGASPAGGVSAFAAAAWGGGPAEAFRLASQSLQSASEPASPCSAWAASRAPSMPLPSVPSPTGVSPQRMASASGALPMMVELPGGGGGGPTGSGRRVRMWMQLEDVHEGVPAVGSAMALPSAQPTLGRSGAPPAAEAATPFSFMAMQPLPAALDATAAPPAPWGMPSGAASAAAPQAARLFTGAPLVGSTSTEVASAGGLDAWLDTLFSAGSVTAPQAAAAPPPPMASQDAATAALLMSAASAPAALSFSDNFLLQHMSTVGAGATARFG